jgi:predicted enzyme related to lactoylglutathione lyase
VSGSGCSTGSRRGLVYVRVDDVEAILQKIVEGGVEIIVPRTPPRSQFRIAHATK